MIRRIDRRIRAIWAEQAKRESERVQAAKRRKVDVRKRLEAVLEFAPDTAEALRVIAVERMAAHERVSQLAADLRLLGGTSRLGERIADLRAGVETVAAALGETAPKLPEFPRLPDYEAVNANLHCFSLPRDGYSDLVPKIGDAGKADALVEELKG